MPSWLHWLLDSGLVQTKVRKAIAWLATASAGWVVVHLTTLLSAHGFVVQGDLLTKVQDFGGDVGALVTGGLALLWSLKDADHVDVALKATAKTGQVVTPAQASAITKGEPITLPNGKTVTIGLPSPSGGDPDAETAALNKSQTAKKRTR